MNLMISLGIRYYKEILIGLCLLFAMIFVLFLGVDIPKDNTVPLTEGGVAVVSPLVQRYEPILRKYAREHGIESYVPLMMALMQQESGGRGGDPMQSSESQGHPPGYFQNPEESIKYGVLHFKNVITNAKGDIKLALQSYNFGPGFIDYVLARGGKYTAELAREFSAYMSGKLGWTCSYWQTSPFCYGDIKYVEHVLRYYQEGATAVSVVSTTANAYGFIQPISNPKVTSPFGYRVDPFDPLTGAPVIHKGVDYSCGGKPIPIYAVKAGIVSRAGWQDPNNHGVGYGQRVYVDHGNGQVTVYGHLSKIDVQEGQRVQQGQPVGACGTTGSSTGMHLHLELRLNGTAVDPLPYIK